MELDRDGYQTKTKSSMAKASKASSLIVRDLTIIPWSGSLTAFFSVLSAQMGTVGCLTI
jgi:hypothetical protein